MDAQVVDEILSKHKGNQGGLTAILQEVQSVEGYLSREALTLVARKTGRPLVEVYAVATFFRAFSLKPRGKHLICLCTGTACHVRGTPRILDEFTRLLGIPPGQTTADGQITLETVNCLGACALGPIVMVDRRYYSNVDAPKVAKIIDDSRNGEVDSDKADGKAGFPVEVTCPHCGRSLMDPAHMIAGHPSIRLGASFDNTKTSLSCSAVYGDGERLAAQAVPDGTVLGLACPKCGVSLVDEASCPECGSPMAELAVARGCALRLCTRHGCDGHMLDVGLIPKTANEGQDRPGKASAGCRNGRR